MSTEAPASDEPPLFGPRVELALIALATAVGGFLRFVDFGSIGLSHFDEGVYATSGLWPWTGGFDYHQAYYSPPVFPFLVGLVNLAVGAPWDGAGAFVSAVFGTLTIPLVAWVGREWSGRSAGPAVGVVAGWLVALSGLHILFSRVGLTDALFTFCFVLATHAVFRTTLAPTGPPTWRALFLAGAAVGLTWNVKYNGFLPVVLALGLAPGVGWSTRLCRLVVIATTAAACYAPWALQFHVKHLAEGGYALLAAHQRGYVIGVNGATLRGVSAFLWWTELRGPDLAVGMTFLVSAAVARARSWSDRRRAALLLFAATTIYLLPVEPAAFGATVLVLVGLAADGSIRLARRAWPALVLAALPTLYTPYLRLWLPTFTLAALATAAALVHLVGVDHGGRRRARW
ncbi:MAG: ArnT family glycosyltransferase, partial [Planctomycetia bacterium]